MRGLLFIQCSASEYTELLQLITNKDDEEKQTGCVYSTGKWLSIDHIFGQRLISISNCVTAAQPTVTEQLRGLNFWCRGHDSAESTDRETESVTVGVTRGKLIVNYLLYSKYFSRLK